MTYKVINVQFLQCIHKNVKLHKEPRFIHNVSIDTLHCGGRMESSGTEEVADAH